MALIVNNNVNPCIGPNASLELDQACLSIWNSNSNDIAFYTNPSECYMCDGILWGNLPANQNTSLVISTKYPLHSYYVNEEKQVCSTTYMFKEHGNYGWNFTKDGCSQIEVLYNPPDPYLPILGSFMVIVLSAIVFATSMVIIRIVRGKMFPNTTGIHDDLDRLHDTESTVQPVIRTSKISTRIRSIDTFRGIAVLLMIFVNNGGGKYVFFQHSAWNGLTVADLVLPWFAWVMGITIVVSNRAELRITNSRIKIIYKCFRRAMTLILFGLIINSLSILRHNGSTFLSSLRFPGVLQLLALSYFICATLEIIFMKQHTQDSLLLYGRFTFLRDILDSWVQWLIVIVITVARTLVIFLSPVPNCPKSYFGPGGYHYHGKYVNCTGGAIGYIDRLIFGNHIYSNTENPVYGHILPHDPEGLLNSMSAILIVFLGVQAGRILLHYYQYHSRLIRWLFWSFLTGIIAGILCKFDKEDGIIPVNKKMMSLSFVLVTSSFAFILYAILYFLVDYKQWWSGAPFNFAGTNALLLYIGHYFTMDLFPWAWKTAAINHTSYLAMNLWTTTLWALIAYYFYKKDIILTV